MSKMENEVHRVNKISGIPALAKNLLFRVIPIILIAVVTISVVSYVYSSKIIREDIDDKMDLMLGKSINHIEGVMLKEKGLAESVARTVENMYKESEAKEFDSLLIKATGINEETVGMGVWFAPNAYKNMKKFAPYAMKSGTDIVASDEYTVSDFDIHTSEWYIVGTTDKGGWTAPYVDTVSGLTMVTISVPMYDGDDILGCVTVDVDITALKSMIEEMQIEYNGKAFLVDTSGLYLAGVSDDKIMTVNYKDDSDTDFASALQKISEDDMLKHLDYKISERGGWNI